MTNTSANLLRLLEPAVRPMGSPPGGSGPSGSIENSSFDRLLRDAAKLPIEMSQTAMDQLRGDGVEIGEKEMAAIRGAMDRAQQSGAQRALVLMDSSALIANVPGRMIEEVVSNQDRGQRVLTDIDTAVWADTSGEAQTEHRIRL